MQDRSDYLNFTVTQEIMSRMLGVRRSGITVAAGDLQRAGLIQYSRGKIRIIDKAGLESKACECLADFKQRTAAFVSELG